MPGIGKDFFAVRQLAKLAAAFFAEVLESASSLAPKFSGTIINFQGSNVQATTTSCPDGVRPGAESDSKLPYSKSFLCAAHKMSDIFSWERGVRSCFSRSCLPGVDHSRRAFVLDASTNFSRRFPLAGCARRQCS